MKNRNIPFGYRYEDGKIVVNPDEQNTLQRICSEYLDGRSLLQIANGLESDKVEFAPGIITWNKARIMRIVDDDRYLGNVTYPQVIDEATVERMRSRKASRNTQTSTDRQSGIYLLKVPVVCPACGKPMHRLQDTRCKCTQKWVSSLQETERNVFLCRYWYLDSIQTISEVSGFSQSKVTSMLHRLRGKLRKTLSEEGYV